MSHDLEFFWACCNNKCAIRLKVRLQVRLYLDLLLMFWFFNHALPSYGQVLSKLDIFLLATQFIQVFLDTFNQILCQRRFWICSKQRDKQNINHTRSCRHPHQTQSARDWAIGKFHLLWSCSGLFPLSLLLIHYHWTFPAFLAYFSWNHQGSWTHLRNHVGPIKFDYISETYLKILIVPSSFLLGICVKCPLAWRLLAYDPLKGHVWLGLVVPFSCQSKLETCLLLSRIKLIFLTCVDWHYF